MNMGVIIALLAAFISLGVVLMAVSQKRKGADAAAREHDDAR